MARRTDAFIVILCELLLILDCSTALDVDGCAFQESSESIHALSLLQTDVSRLPRSGHLSRQQADDEATCTDLKNYGSYFTVEVTVGTPPKKFDLIPDTGSNDIVIPDCKCVKEGKCGTPFLECFDPKKSSSFKATNLTAMQESLASSKAGNSSPTMKNTKQLSKVPDGTTYVVQVYGSGPIVCSMGSDNVSLGDASGMMKDGVLLMQSRTALKVHADFEGLLGMGLPFENDTEPLFMQKAGVDRYSMCFRDAGVPGILRMKIPKLKNPLKNLGRFHWGLDMQGMSVGNESSSVLFCDPKDKKPEMETACGAIPDSGTTLITGPGTQIAKLFVALCDNWPRCVNAYKNSGKDSKSTSKESMEVVFIKLLRDCGTWLGKSGELNDEVPPITLHLGGADGAKQKVDLSPWSWITETDVLKWEEVQKKIFGKTYKIRMPKGMQRTCSPLIGGHQYNTMLNGPVWILGSPLFYDKIVSYDVSAKPPAMSIEDKECKPCDIRFFDSSGDSASRSLRRPLRSLTGPIREPRVDVTLPL